MYKLVIYLDWIPNVYMSDMWFGVALRYIPINK